jgi:hypothetical protein
VSKALRSFIWFTLFAGFLGAGLVGFAFHQLHLVKKPSDLASFKQTLHALTDTKSATETLYGHLPEARDDEPTTVEVAAPPQPTVQVQLPNYVDPKALDRIRAMNIPDDMKARILKTALRTGRVPVIGEPQTHESHETQAATQPDRRLRAPAQAK